MDILYMINRNEVLKKVIEIFHEANNCYSDKCFNESRSKYNEVMIICEENDYYEEVYCKSVYNIATCDMKLNVYDALSYEYVISNLEDLLNKNLKSMPQKLKGDSYYQIAYCHCKIYEYYRDRCDYNIAKEHFKKAELAYNESNKLIEQDIELNKMQSYLNMHRALIEKIEMKEYGTNI